MKDRAKNRAVSMGAKYRRGMQLLTLGDIEECFHEAFHSVSKEVVIEANRKTGQFGGRIPTYEEAVVCV